MKTFSNEEKLRVFTGQHDCSKRNAKRISSGRRELMPQGNLGLQERRKKNRNGKYLGKYIIFFF